jgi:N6-L-threonylcarbamoyladenine synthase
MSPSASNINSEASPRVLLAIETSCDDTAAAVMVGDVLRANVIASQRVHADWGGVVPELASRDHQRLIVPVVEQALAEAEVAHADVGAVAVTHGPGLAGSLLVGLSFAKALALGLGVPLVGVNHLEGHLYSVLIDPPRPPRPYLCLVVSGGHTQLIVVEDGFRHTVLGQTRDDAAGEAFDKVATLLGLPYPGGPPIDRHAQDGDPAFQGFPRTELDGYDFSFSGLKTSVLYFLRDLSDDERARMLEDHLADLCASFQQAVVDVLVGKVREAVTETGIRHVAVVGGVSANTGLRAALAEAAEADGFASYVPKMAYCMDNAAMIAAAARLKLAAGHASALDLDAQPRLSLAD